MLSDAEFAAAKQKLLS
ncbi:hypothetical protein [Microbacterium maritypicum]